MITQQQNLGLFKTTSSQKMVYRVTENSITGTYGNENTFLYTRSNPFFDEVKEMFENSPDIFMEPRGLKDALEAKIQQLVGTVDSQIFEDLGEQFPLAAYSAFVELFTQSQAYKEVYNKARKQILKNSNTSIVWREQTVIEQLLNKKVAITWDGFLVLYARASWFHSGSPMEWPDTNSMLPVTFKDGDMTLGNFDYANQHCADQGLMHELLVNPADLLFCTADGSYKVSGYTPIGRVEHKPNNEGVLFVYPAVSDTGRLLVRNPYSPASAAAYAQQVQINALHLEAVIGQQLINTGC